MSNDTPLTRVETITLYDWARCTHEGIGLPGCRVCDPDKHRVAARYEHLLDTLKADVAEAKATAALHAEAAAKAMRERDEACRLYTAENYERIRIESHIKDPMPPESENERLRTALAAAEKQRDGWKEQTWAEVECNTVIREQLAAAEARESALRERCMAIVAAWDADEIGRVDGNPIEAARAALAASGAAFTVNHQPSTTAPSCATCLGTGHIAEDHRDNAEAVPCPDCGGKERR